MINIIGSIASTSGYASHCRNLSNALFKITETRLTTFIPPGFEREMTDAEIEMVSRKPQDDEWNLIIDLPYNWKMNLKGEKNIGFLVWEGDRIPKSFIKDLEDERIKYIFVPSSHTLQAIQNTISSYPSDVIKKVHIIPHGVDLSLFYPVKKSEVFTFLFNGGFRNEWDRKGLQYVLEAYLNEFKKGEALLRIHINPAYGNYITEYLNKKANANSPDIYLDFGYYPNNKLREIYQGNVLVSPVRAEAYGLQHIEAMACGLPVITTSFGGQTDFCNLDNSWIINGELKEVKNEVFYEGIQWLVPDINELRKAMREAFENKELLESKRLKALETAKENTWDLTAQKILALLK